MAPRHVDVYIYTSLIKIYQKCFRFCFEISTRKTRLQLWREFGNSNLVKSFLCAPPSNNQQAG